MHVWIFAIKCAYIAYIFKDLTLIYVEAMSQNKWAAPWTVTMCWRWSEASKQVIRHIAQSKLNRLWRPSGEQPVAYQGLCQYSNSSALAAATWSSILAAASSSSALASASWIALSSITWSRNLSSSFSATYAAIFFFLDFFFRLVCFSSYAWSGAAAMGCLDSSWIGAFLNPSSFKSTPLI